MLSGLVASWALTILYGQAQPSAAHLASAGLIIVALLFLSPLHHFGFYMGKLNRAFSAALRRSEASFDEQARGAALSFVTGPSPEGDTVLRSKLRRMFIFVCNGNTSRSPMAQAICSHEIAMRLGVSMEEHSRENVRIISAGLAAKPGSPMKRHARSALQQLQVISKSHASQSLTPGMVEQAEKIFCMTRSQRQGVIADFSAPPDKVLLLDPHGDIEEPLEADPDAFVKCAKRIWALVAERLDELGITGPTLATGATGD
jgi:protein-tyrosine-phosphatase